MANRGTRLGGPRLVLCEAGACAEVPANTRDTVHRRNRTTGDHRGCSVVAVVVRRFGARGRRRYERCDAQSDQQGTAQAPMLGHRDTRFPWLRAERTTRNRGRAGISRLCARCGSLRSTSPAAGSRTRWMVPVGRSTDSVRAISAGGCRSFATLARPDFCHRLEVRSCLPTRPNPAQSAARREPTCWSAPLRCCVSAAPRASRSTKCWPAALRRVARSITNSPRAGLRSCAKPCSTPR